MVSDSSTDFTELGKELEQAFAEPTEKIELIEEKMVDVQERLEKVEDELRKVVHRLKKHAVLADILRDL